MRFLKSNIVNILSMLTIMIWVLPFSKVYLGLESFGDSGWYNKYLYEDIVSVTIFFPFLIFLVLYQLSKKESVKNIFYWLMLVLSIVYLLLGMMSLLIGSMDLVPSYGSFLVVLFFPLVMGVKYYKGKI